MIGQSKGRSLLVMNNFDGNMSLSTQVPQPYTSRNLQSRTLCFQNEGLVTLICNSIHLICNAQTNNN